MAFEERDRRHQMSIDMGQLTGVRDEIWEIQKARIEEKSPEYGSYQDINPEIILENLGRNLVQFTVACEGGPMGDIKKQGADIMNLVLMIIDHRTRPRGRA